MGKLLAAAASLAVLAAVAATVPAALGHQNPCHSQHACPSDHHTYPWNGLWCTSYADERLPSDTKTVVWDGRTYWCHGQGSAQAGDPDAGSGATCGVERWAVKTLQDPLARRVDLRPRRTTVAALRRLGAPEGLPDTRLAGVERRTYRIVANVVAAKVEGDSDIHLVVADPRSGGTMIVEFPALGCTTHAAAAVRKLMERARVALLRSCGDPGSGFAEIRGRATITGVGFFDFLHGQRGVAPNGIELHPVTGFSAPSCRPG